MSYLKWTLDTEEGIDAYDPLGKIVIIGDQGQLEEKCTYLDAFFEALIQGVQEIEKEKTIEIDPLVEPDNIIFDYISKNLVISYAKQKVTIFDKDQFVKDIREAVNNLLDELDNAAINKKEERPRLIILRQFLKNAD